MTSRLAVQQALLPGSTPMEQFRHAAAFGFDGIELNHGARFDVREHRELLAEASRATGVGVAAICTTGQQDPVHPDPGERERRVRELVELVDVASALGAAGVVSVPVRPAAGFEEAPSPDLVVETYQHAVDELGEGSAAIFLEPLNRYEATFLNPVGQAAALARMIDRTRVQALADLFHMNIEETSFVEAIMEAGDHIGHVHLAGNTRLEPGVGMLDPRPAFGALRKIGYEGWLSLECRLSGPPENVLPASARYLRSKWDEAGA